MALEVVKTDPALAQLESWIERIWDKAAEFGLTPFSTHFEVVPATIMYEFGSYGLPGRFSHWTHGRAYNQMKTMYDYGLSKIYELVVNTDPCYAFLMEANSPLENKLVVAHVLAHCDFFRNNAFFTRTNRQMVETASINAERIRRYEFEHGTREVERFLDAVLSIEDHVDPLELPHRRDGKDEDEEEKPRARTTPYDDLLELDEPHKEEAPPRLSTLGKARKFPREPQRDLLAFLMEHAPDLEDWQRDVIAIVRQERLYFAPQMRTKILNEGWACATGDSLLATEHGFVRFRDLYDGREKLAVGSGGTGELHPITDFHKEEDVPTLRIVTRRGYTIEGALKHQVQLADGSWTYLHDVHVGHQVTLAAGTDVWPSAPVALQWAPAQADVSLAQVALAAGTSLSTVMRHRAGLATRRGAAIVEALAETAYRGAWAGRVLPTRSTPVVRATLDAPLAYLLGYFVGDGNVTKSGICLTCGDEGHARRLGELFAAALGLRASVRDDATATGPQWRVEVHSRELLRLLEQLGIDLSASAPDKRVPAAVLGSPKDVVAAFLRGYFDADGYAGPAGIILSSASLELVRTVQIILLNYGILSTQRPQADGCVHLEVRGTSALRFQEHIGFQLERKHAALRGYVDRHQWFKREEAADEVVKIEAAHADVYDITVDVAHTYVANGFVNHNSFWHSRILRELDLPEDEYTEFARLHSSVAAPSPRSLNPYYVGMKLLEHVEQRWENPSDKDKERMGLPGGQGREKLFEIRDLESDLSFMRTYLTKDAVEELDLYTYEHQDGAWKITEKNWEKVRDQIVRSLTTYGIPYIMVEDADYKRNRELYLKHYFDGDELDVKYGEKTMQYVYQLWGRPVHVETVLDGKPFLLTYDGTKHAKTSL